ncbi:MAG: O-antigen ligase family protein [Bacteroidota bacterium]
MVLTIWVAAWEQVRTQSLSRLIGGIMPFVTLYLCVYGTTTVAVGFQDPSVPLLLLIPMGFYAAQHALKVKDRRWLLAALVVLLMLMRARTPMAIGFVLLALAEIQRSPRLAWLKVVGIGGSALAVFALLIAYYEPFRVAFFEGDNAVQLGGLALNTSGRAYLWSTVWASFLESPWYGQGLGASAQLIRAIGSQAEHPHNDYLRLMHDMGLIGLGWWILFALSSYGLVRLGLRQALHPDEAVWHVTARNALLVISLSMITDNAVVYAFVMYPLGVLLGISAGFTRSTSRRGTP